MGALASPSTCATSSPLVDISTSPRPPPTAVRTSDFVRQPRVSFVNYELTPPARVPSRGASLVTKVTGPSSPFSRASPKKIRRSLTVPGIASGQGPAASGVGQGLAGGAVHGQGGVDPRQAQDPADRPPFGANEDQVAAPLAQPRGAAGQHAQPGRAQVVQRAQVDDHQLDAGLDQLGDPLAHASGVGRVDLTRDAEDGGGGPGRRGDAQLGQLDGTGGPGRGGLLTGQGTSKLPGGRLPDRASGGARTVKSATPRPTSRRRLGGGDHHL